MLWLLGVGEVAAPPLPGEARGGGVCQLIPDVMIFPRHGERFPLEGELAQHFGNTDNLRFSHNIPCFSLAIVFQFW